MGLIKGGGGGTYLRVHAGKLSKKVGPEQYEEYDGFEGIITGIRYEDGVRPISGKDQKFSSLYVRMLDPQTGEEVIIVGPMFYYHKITGAMDGISVWSRMLLSRLGAFRRAENSDYVRDPNGQAIPALTRDDVVAISFYQWNEATCVAVRKRGESATVTGDPITDPDRLIAAIAFLTERYGPWEREIVPAAAKPATAAAAPDPAPGEIAAYAAEQRREEERRKNEDLPF